MAGYAGAMNTPFGWRWDYDRGETVADAVIHIEPPPPAVASSVGEPGPPPAQ